MTRFNGIAEGIARLRRLLAEPSAEWRRIAQEPRSPGHMFKAWVLPMAAIGPVARAIGSLFLGWGAYGVTLRPSVGEALATAALSYVLSIAGVAFVAFAAAGMAPGFGGKRDWAQAMKLAGYSATALFAAGIFELVPGLVFLSLLGIYSFYLIGVGAPKLLCPEAKQFRAYGMTVAATAVVTYAVLFTAVGILSDSFPKRMQRVAVERPADGFVPGSARPARG